MALRPALLALVAALVGALAGGCGHDGASSPPPAAQAARPRPAQTPAPARPAVVAIATPGPGATVPSGEVTVAGTADPQQTVRVDGGCPAPACRTTVFTGLEGRWRARVRLAAAGRSRRATLRAHYAARAGAAARVRVHLAPAPAVRPRPAPRPRRAPTPAPAAAASASAPPRLVLVGDSLAVGVRELLPAQLPGWRVAVDAGVGRGLADGLRALAAEDAGGGRLVIAASLFTNEEPTRLDALAAAVQDTLARAGPDGCAVWATVSRPPQHGVGYGPANRLLEQLAARPASSGRLVLVPWAEQVAARPRLLRGDHVHATPAGYALLARLYAQAARSCL
jgi:hypothetical protein